MVESPFLSGPRKNDEDKAAGAQTERRGDAGPVRSLLGGKASPADDLYFSSLVSFHSQIV
jgi:hypothetical protein